MRVRIPLVALALLATARFGLGHEPTLSRFNYRDHVRPIFVKHCGGCHRSGGVAPMSLLDYQEAVPWANAIKLQLLEQRMPPFLPDDESGPFRDRRSLTAEELDILVDWAVGATPQGEPLESSNAEPSTAAFTSGTPDLVLEPAGDVVLGEDEYEKTACVVLPTGLERARVATGFEIVPGLRTIVRRATILAGSSCTEGEPIQTWLPDQGRSAFPPGLGRELGRGSSLALELRYVKGWNDEGKTMRDRTSVGIWFSDEAVGVDSLRVERETKLAEPATLLSLYPEASSSGELSEPLRVEAVGPDGTTRSLLSISTYDPEWREKYTLAQPISLPAGTVIRSSQPAVWVDLLSSSRSAAE